MTFQFPSDCLAVCLMRLVRHVLTGIVGRRRRRRGRRRRVRVVKEEEERQTKSEM